MVSRYPYESDKGNSLQSEGDEVQKLYGLFQLMLSLVKSLQKQVLVTGAKILSVQLNEISYAPEIAQGMLRKQQVHLIFIC